MLEGVDALMILNKIMIKREIRNGAKLPTKKIYFQQEQKYSNSTLTEE